VYSRQYFLWSIDERKYFKIDLFYRVMGKKCRVDPIHKALPISSVYEDDRHRVDTFGLHKGDRLEELIKRAETSRKDDKGLRIL